ncbi:MAG: hypothetical protein ABI632_13945, partial [Pseudolysinimonas sp.]
MDDLFSFGEPDSGPAPHPFAGLSPQASAPQGLPAVQSPDAAAAAPHSSRRAARAAENGTPDA